MEWNELKQIIGDEIKKLEFLLNLLKEQYIFIMNKDVFSLEEVVEKIEANNKEVAIEEVKRRKLVGNRKMKDIVNESNDKDLDRLYRDIRKTIQAVKFQKDTNELLLKQQIGFNAQLLNLINPRRDIKTYTSLGNLSR